MKPVVIENPILNTPFSEPSRHFYRQTAQVRKKPTYNQHRVDARSQRGIHVHQPGAWADCLVGKRGCHLASPPAGLAHIRLFRNECSLRIYNLES